jgi:hypothetical protein
VHDIGQSQPCKQERQQHRKGLRGHHAPVPAIPVADISTDRSQYQHRNLVGKAEYTEQRRGTRQPVHQPQLRSRLHPRSDQRNELACNEQLKIAMFECAKARGHEETLALQ